MNRESGPGDVTLTPRQREVLQLLLDGLGEKEIAAKLMISRHTVHNHIKALHRAYGVASRGELLARLFRVESEAGSPILSGELDEADYRTLVEQAPDRVLQVDRAGVIRYLNTSETGFRREEILGTPMIDHSVVEDRPLLRQALDAAFETAQCQELTARAIGADGIARRYHLRLNPVVSAGRIEYAVVVAREIEEPPDRGEGAGAP